MSVLLKDVAKVIRSKNAGPYTLTFDILFKEDKFYYELKETGCINKELIAKAYNISIEDVEEIIYFEPSKAIKINIHRPIASGDIGERDVYGAQQHIPLSRIKLNIKGE